jgi:hypothetical protein
VIDIIEKLFAAPLGGELPPVSDTPEFQRVLHLPRRQFDADSYQDLTPLFAREEGTLKLRAIQSAMLWEAVAAGGLLANAKVGSGKTLTTLLLPEALRSERALLLLPARMRDQLHKADIPFYGAHFYLPRIDPDDGVGLTIHSYEEIGTRQGAAILEALNPDLVICDEAHALRHLVTARGRRVVRFERSHPDVRWCFLSGTLTNDSLLDYAHLAEMALHKNSPLPSRRHWHELSHWAAALDADAKAPPGVLVQLAGAGATTPRGAFKKRLAETRGVVLTHLDGCGASLEIRAYNPVVPPVVEAALNDLRGTWRIGATEALTAMQLAQIARQVSQGFHYSWEWPGGVENIEWKEARAAWNRVMREELQRGNRPGHDSPGILFRAALEGHWPGGEAAAERWDIARCSGNIPDTVTTWLDPYLIHAALEWECERTLNRQRGIIWYEHQAVGQELAKNGIPVYGSGMDLQLLDATADVIACSRPAHGQGKNLQAWQHNLFLMPMANGQAWEQAIARTHRDGQKADAVFVDVCLQTPENVAAFAAALKDARYIEETTGQPQKLLQASKGIGVPR